MRRTFLLILVLVLASAGQAWAGANDVLRDCGDDGALQGSYSQRELREAVASIPGDLEEYTDCRDVIKAAQLAGASDTGGGGGNGDDGAGGTGTGTGTDTGAGNATGTGPGADTGDAGSSGLDGGADTGDDAGTATSTGSDEGDENPPTGSTAGSFGGFSGFERDPLRAAAAEERDAIEEAIASRPPVVARGAGPFADTDLPTALWVVLALGAAGLIALAASDLRRRVVARHDA